MTIQWRCLVKTLTGTKNPVGKNILDRRKKEFTKVKWVRFWILPLNLTYPPENYTHGNLDNLRNPIPRACFWNVDFKSDLVKRSAKFSWDQICLTLIFWCSYCWCEKKNLGAICSVLSPLIYPFFICSTQTVLSSWIAIGASLIEDNPLVLWIYSIIALNQTHSLVASWSAVSYAWFKEVTTKICSVNLQHVTIFSMVKT